MTPSLRHGQAVLAHLGSNGSSYQSSNQSHGNSVFWMHHITSYTVRCILHRQGPTSQIDRLRTRCLLSVSISRLFFSSHSRGTYTCLSYARTSRMRQPTLYFTFTHAPPTGIQSAQEFRNKGARARARARQSAPRSHGILYTTSTVVCTLHIRLLNLLNHCPQNQPCHCANKFVINRCTHSSRQRRDRRVRDDSL